VGRGGELDHLNVGRKASGRNLRRLERLGTKKRRHWPCVARGEHEHDSDRAPYRPRKASAPDRQPPHSSKETKPADE